MKKFEGIHFHGTKKASIGDDETLYDEQFIRIETKTESMNFGADLYASAAWTCASSHFGHSSGRSVH